MTPRRVATANAVIPQPSDELFEAMAREMFDVWHFEYDPPTVPPKWDEAAAVDRWINAARAAYAIIAERGGGKVTPIGAKP